MRINLAQTKSMKRYLVYTTDDSRTRPFDPTRFLASATLQNRRFRPPVEKVRLATFRRKIDVFGSTLNGFGRAKTAGLPAVFFEGLW
jgi:hypothetical protein